MFSSDPARAWLPPVMQLQMPFYVICTETNVMF